MVIDESEDKDSHVSEDDFGMSEDEEGVIDENEIDEVLLLVESSKERYLAYKQIVESFSACAYKCGIYR